LKPELFVLVSCAMKFGKQLDSQSLPKFRGYYIQYKELKNALKVFTGQDKDQATVLEVTHWTSSFLRLGPNPEVGPEARLQEILAKERDRICKFCELEEQAMKEKLDALEADCIKSNGTWSELQQRLDEAADEIVQLKSFTRLNFSGFRKLLKKYDKWSRSNVLPWFMSQVARSAMMTVSYDDLLTKLNRVAIALRRAAPIEVEHSRARSRAGSFEEHGTARSVSFDWNSSSPELVFLVDMKDTMRVKVELAKALRMESSSAAQGRTTSSFFDTANLDIYQSHLWQASLQAEGETPEPACSSVHFRHMGGELVCIACDEPFRAQGCEALVGRTDASRLASGLIPAATSTLSGPPVGLASSRKLAKGPERKEVLGSAQRVLQSNLLRPVVQASYARTAFIDDSSGMQILLDEDVRMAQVKKWEATPSGTQIFPSDVLTVSLAGTRGMEVPRWLRRVYNIADLFEVSGFSKAAHAVAQFEGKPRGMQLPHWYDRVMDICDVQEEAEIGEERPASKASSSTAAPQQDPLMSVLPQHFASPAMRLVHEFGSGQELGPPPSVAPLSLRPADDVLGRTDLAAPLLASIGKERGTAHIARPWNGFVSKVLRRLWFGRETGCKTGEDLPVRCAIVAVQPKTLYSNERTYLDWIHFATMFGAVGLGVLHAAETMTEVLLGRFLLVVAIVLVMWSLHTFNWRAEALNNKEDRTYHDPIGPALLILSLIIALVWFSLHASGWLGIEAESPLKPLGPYF